MGRVVAPFRAFVAPVFVGAVAADAGWVVVMSISGAVARMNFGRSA
jgi:hypothetical protein